MLFLSAQTRGSGTESLHLPQRPIIIHLFDFLKPQMTYWAKLDLVKHHNWNLLTLSKGQQPVGALFLLPIDIRKRWDSNSCLPIQELLRRLTAKYFPGPLVLNFNDQKGNSSDQTWLDRCSRISLRITGTGKSEVEAQLCLQTSFISSILWMLAHLSAKI